MHETEFSLSYLAEKCNGIPFQVWSYNADQNEVRLFHSSTNTEQNPPNFHQLTEVPNRQYELIASANQIELFYFFPDDHKINVRFLHPYPVLSEHEIVYLYHFFYLSYMKEQMDSKDLELTNLVDSIRAISSSLNIDDVLKKIMQNALKIIPATDAGYLLLYNADENRLIPKAPIGFGDNIYNFKVKIGESITGKVFEDGKGRIFNSSEEIFKVMDVYNVSDDNYHHIVSSAKTPVAAICVPISINGIRIGAMIIHQWKRKKIMTQHDLKLLEGFAEQAAIAIQNAQYYAEAEEKITIITELSEELKEINHLLQKRQFVHESLTNISLENKGFETIIYEFNQMIGQPVSFYNALENIFYTGNTPNPPYFTMQELKNLFIENRQPIYVNHFYLYPVYNGTIFLGCLIVQVENEISTSDRMTLEQGTPLLILDLIKKQTITEYFYRKTHEQFQALLNYVDKNQLFELANEMGLTPSTYWFIAIVEIPDYTDLQRLETQIHQLTSEFKAGANAFKKIIYGYNNQVILLVSLPKLDQFSEIRRKVQLIQDKWTQNNQLKFRIGMSSIYEGLENIRICYEEATKTLSYLASRNSSETLRYDEIGLNKLFIHQPTAEINQFIADVFGPLWTKEEHHKELEETLIIYIETNRSASKAAKKLHIHTNTLYQRLKKIEELLHLTLDDPADILKIQLACHLQTTYTGASRP